MRAGTRMVTVLLVAALAATACSDNGDDADGSPDPTVTTTSPTATATDTPTSGPDTGTSTPTPTGTDTDTEGNGDDDGTAAQDRCRKSDVRVSLRDLESAPGRRYAEVVLTNATGTNCTVQGYGGLQLLDSERNPVPTRLVRLDRPQARAVELEPGDSAVSRVSFSVVATDNDRRRGSCQPEASFALVTAPDQTRNTRIPWNLGPVCDRGRIEQTAYTAAG